MTEPTLPEPLPANYETGSSFTAADEDIVEEAINLDTTAIRALQAAGSGSYTKPSGGIPESDLASALRAKIDSAGSGSYTKPSGGIPATDLTAAVQSELTAASTAYQKPSGGIPATDLATAVQEIVGATGTPSLLQVGPNSWYELMMMPDNARWLGMNIVRYSDTDSTRMAAAMAYYAANDWEVLWGASPDQPFSYYANQAAFNAAYIAKIDSVMNVYGPRGSYWTSVALNNGPATGIRYNPIAQVQIMNEPNFSFPFSGGNSFAPQYASALIAAYDHIKANWPEVTVVGFSAGAAQYAGTGWITAVLNALQTAGRLDAFDVVAFQPYVDGIQSPEGVMYEAWMASPTRPISIQGSVATYAALPRTLTSGDAGKAYEVDADYMLYVWNGTAWPSQGYGQTAWHLDTSIQALKQLLISRGITKPLWITETGWKISHADGGYYTDSGTDNLGNVEYVSLDLQAAYSVRVAMAAARADVERVYYMYVCDDDGGNFGWFNTNSSALAASDPAAMTAAPRPSGTAMRLLNRLIAAATRFEVVIDGSSAPATAPYVYRFTTPRGRVTVAWCQGGSTTTIPIDPDTAMTVTDQVGGIITVLPAGTTSYAATLSATPIFISCAGSAALGAFSVQGSVATYSALPTGLTIVNAGYGYEVLADGLMYVWSGTAWPSNGSGVQFRGPRGVGTSAWWNGSGAPGTVSGAVAGDYYLDNATGNVYEMS